MVKIEIQKCDIPFICEAIEQRACYLTEALMGATMSSLQDQINELKGLADTEGEEIPTPKKPHWTQTAKGKKILSRRRKKK